MKDNLYYSDFLYPKKVQPLDNYRLKITFDDEIIKTFDVKPYLKNKFWEPLKDKTLFDRVFIEGSIAWPGNIDIAPEEIWHNSK